MKPNVMFVALVITLAVLLIPTSSYAHGTPQISVSPDTVAAGGQVTLSGETMGANEEFTISLEGLKFTAKLGEVKSDDKEAFKVQFTIPANAPEGVYNVKAVGKDGDTVTAELTVTGPLKTPTPVAGQAPAPLPTPQAGVQPAPQPTEGPMPSAAAHEILRSHTPLDVAGLLAAIVVSAGVGLLLIRSK